MNDLFSALQCAVRVCSIGAPVIYASRQVLDTLWMAGPKGGRVKARINARRRRGPRLRDIVRSPSQARRRIRAFQSLTNALGPGLTSPPRPWLRLALP